MSMINWDDVVAFAPELSTTEPAAQLYILDYVNTQIKPSEFGGEASPSLRLARIFLAAHNATFASSSVTGQTGAVTEEEVGDIRRKYGEVSTSSTASISALESTNYGQMYLGLANRSAARSPVII